ncbi:JAB domain-containing protein [Pedobacter sp. P26]|uniref:JAB domain-containing protein n=1 Tax=Pedobacter sp. P26 TaxID=3423956 RepID=UPI003D67B1F3
MLYFSCHLIKLLNSRLKQRIVEQTNIFDVELTTNRSKKIISHNHPSDSLRPGDADSKLPQKLK